MVSASIFDWFVRPHSLAMYHIIVIVCAAMAASIAATISVNSVLDRASRYYAATFIVLCSAFAFYFVLFDVNDQWLTQERSYFSSLQMCFGPLLYLYTCNLTMKHHRWRKAYMLHFLPAPLLMLLWWWQVSTHTPSFLMLDCDLSTDCQIPTASRALHKWLSYLSIISYSVLVLGQVKSHQIKIRAYFSAIEDIQLRWLSVTAYCAIISMLVSVGYESFSYLELVPRYSQNIMFAIAPAIILLLFAFFSSYQTNPVIEQASAEASASAKLAAKTSLIENSKTKTQLVPTSEVNSVLNEDNNKKANDGLEQSSQQEEVKYRTSSLTTEAAAQLWQKITLYVEREKAFLIPGLKIVDIANALEHPVHHISETINGYAGLSFYDLINRYRILEAADYLRNKPEKSVTDIGYEVGFNSTSTFFTHFKKQFEQTPRKYRQQALAEQLTNDDVIKASN